MLHGPCGAGYNANSQPDHLTLSDTLSLLLSLPSTPTPSSFYTNRPHRVRALLTSCSKMIIPCLREFVTFHRSARAGFTNLAMSMGIPPSQPSLFSSFPLLPSSIFVHKEGLQGVLRLHLPHYVYYVSYTCAQ